MIVLTEPTAAMTARLKTLREQAKFFTQPRRKDGDLYKLLVALLAFCEDIERDGLLDTLRDALRVSVDVRGQGNAGRGRRYTEASSDVFILVARHALDRGAETRDSQSAYRYAATLREASKRQIRSEALFEWLVDNGGVNALFKSRPVTTRTTRTKTLNLTSQIEVPKGVTFTLTLLRTETGFYSVIAGPNPPPQP